jgi:ABC-type multidrug transport system ATPase subunit
MKTLSFHELKVGRGPAKILLELDTASQASCFLPGLQLIVAPNGKGKTTLLQTISGVLPSFGGEARLDSKKLDPETDVLYVSEYLTFPKFVYPAEWIEFVSGARPSEELDRWIDAFSLRPRMSSYLGRMSQGERRKVTWLGAHATKKSVLLLDEPLDGLDLLAIRAAREMVQAWRDQQRIVTVVAHQIGDLIDLADQVFLIQHKRLVSWTEVFGTSWRELDSDAFRRAVLEFYS